MSPHASSKKFKIWFKGVPDDCDLYEQYAPDDCDLYEQSAPFVRNETNIINTNVITIVIFFF